MLVIFLQDVCYVAWLMVGTLKFLLFCEKQSLWPLFRPIFKPWRENVTMKMKFLGFFMVLLWSYRRLGTITWCVQKKILSIQKKKKARSFQILPLGGILCGHVTGNFEVPDHGLRACVLIMIYVIFQMWFNCFPFEKEFMTKYIMGTNTLLSITPR